MKSLFWSLLFGALNVRQVGATCYNPDGSAIADVAYQPCNQVSGVFSMCCGTNHTGVVAPDICLPDGLCQNSGDSVYWRQGCTDKTWKSTNCLSQLCTTKSEGGDPTTNVAVGQCSDGSWCCGGVNATCCQAKAGVVLAATIGASSTSSSSSTATSQSSSSAGTSTFSVTSSTSITSATNTPTSNAPSGGLDSGAKIGIGVGVTGGVIAIIAVAGAFLILRKRRASDPSVQHGTGQPFIPYHEVEATKTYPVEAPEYVHRAELPNGRRNVELAA